MMYSNKLAVALKANGKVLRELQDTVYVPFGTEYTILIKNLNTVRASVTVTVDGQDATENVSLIINPRDELELTRFIKNGNLNQGNRFKFIERTASVEEYRGVGVEDGLIRIEFEFEVERVPMKSSSWLSQNMGQVGGMNSPLLGRSDRTTDVYAKGATTNAPRSRTFSSNALMMSDNVPMASAAGPYAADTIGTATASYASNEVGITVPGSVSSQVFSTTYGITGDGVKHAIVLKMLGVTDAGTPVIAPVTVKAKPKCTTCGRVNQVNAKFCSNCGTSLVLV
jgi:hypothetical protein